MDAKLLYSAGYQGLSLEALIAKAEQLDAVVADIRYSPLSFNPQWAGTNLRKALGPRYVHILAFGNRNYKSAALPFDLVDSDTGVKVMERLLKTKSVILLCVCKHVDRCHRKLVSEILYAELGLGTIHLTKGEIEEALPTDEQLDLFA